MDILTNDINQCNLEIVDELVCNLKSYVEESATRGVAVHQVEETLFRQLFLIGQQALGCFFSLQGDGDVGEILRGANGICYQKLRDRTRRYRSLFGCYELTRASYGTYEGKKIEIVPLDTRLQLPQEEHSYLLQNWGQMLSSEVPYQKSLELLTTLFPVSMSVDTLEQTNRAFGDNTNDFQAQLLSDRRAQLATLEPEEQATLSEDYLVLSADGKGIPMRRSRQGARVELRSSQSGPKPDSKRMAVVGSVYTIAPYERTAEDVVEALFAVESNDNATQRPSPAHKLVVAHLNRTVNGEKIVATTATVDWLKDQAASLSPYIASPTIVLMDGQLSLWNEIDRQITSHRVEILDLLHAISRLWDIAHVFFDHHDPAKWSFMRERVRRLLEGKAKAIVRGARQMATKRELPESKRTTLEKACCYLENNYSRMKYDEYLAAGYPIASGVIEGACRHFVKDRMERAGMQWTEDGAQAMLNVRAQRLNDNWDEFTQYRMQKEIEKNHPHKSIIEARAWPLAA